MQREIHNPWLFGGSTLLSFGGILTAAKLVRDGRCHLLPSTADDLLPFRLFSAHALRDAIRFRGAQAASLAALPGR